MKRFHHATLHERTMKAVDASGLTDLEVAKRAKIAQSNMSRWRQRRVKMGEASSNRIMRAIGKKK